MIAFVPDFGPIYIMLLLACLLIAIVLKMTAKFARRLGQVNVIEESLWLLWIFCIGALLIAGFFGILIGIFVGGNLGWSAFGGIFFIGVCTTTYMLLCAPQIKAQQRSKAVVLAASQAAWALLFTIGLIALYVAI